MPGGGSPDMGCDIHVIFETQNADGVWDLTFPIKPSEWWYESIVDHAINTGSAALVMHPTGRNPDYDRTPGAKNEEYHAFVTQVTDHYKSLPEETVMERFGSHPKFSADFNNPEMDIGQRWNFRISTRDYDWFAFVAQVRGRHPKGFQPRDLPDDIHPSTAAEYKKGEGDWHTASWLMVSELLAHPVLDDNFSFYRKWLTNYIANPEKTRMVFWFDN